MSRTTDEWIGASDDTPAPPRVRLRVWGRDNGTCQCGCDIKIRPGDSWQIDHRTALTNGGQNRESNLRLILTEHHKTKTAQDVAEKAKTNRIRAKHAGIKKPRTITGWRKFDGTKVYATRER